MTDIELKSSAIKSGEAIINSLSKQIKFFFKNRASILALGIFVSLGILFSCGNSTSEGSKNPLTEALILRPDYGECICCGGWLVDLNHDTLRIFNMPIAMDSTLSKMQIPVKVLIDWKYMTDGCGAAMKNRIILVNTIKLK